MHVQSHEFNAGSCLNVSVSPCLIVSASCVLCSMCGNSRVSVNVHLHMHKGGIRRNQSLSKAVPAADNHQKNGLYNFSSLALHRALQGGRDAHYGGQFGFRTGEGPSAGAPTHKVRIRNHYADQDIEVEVPEDRWVYLSVDIYSGITAAPQHSG